MSDTSWQQAWPLLPLEPAGNRPPEMTRPDFVELVLQIKQQFDIQFSTAEVTKLRRIQLSLSGTARPLRQSLYAPFFAKLFQNAF
jgi:hypothetical protein